MTTQRKTRMPKQPWERAAELVQSLTVPSDSDTDVILDYLGLINSTITSLRALCRATIIVGWEEGLTDAEMADVLKVAKQRVQQIRTEELAKEG